MSEENQNKNQTPGGENDIFYAGLSYLPIMGLVFYFTTSNPMIKKNATQGSVLFVGMILCWILAMLPFIGWIFGVVLIMIFGYMIAGCVKAIQTGEMITIPFLTKYLDGKSLEDVAHDIQHAAQELTHKDDKPEAPASEPEGKQAE
jgi:uncharacterized membrane protein